MEYVIKVNGIVLVSNGKSIPFCACKFSPLSSLKSPVCLAGVSTCRASLDAAGDPADV